MWIEAFVHKNKKGLVDIEKIAAERRLRLGSTDRDRVLTDSLDAERIMIYDPLFPGMAIEFKQDDDTADVRLNFPAGSYDIELFFYIVRDISVASECENFFIETTELELDETESLIDYYIECSEEILKILTDQLKDRKVTGLIVLTSHYPFVIGSREADKVDNDLDKYALMINEAQRKKALYCRHWSYTGKNRNFCVYEVKPDLENILPLFPAPFLGRNMPRHCDYYVDVPGIAFFRYDVFMRNYREHSEPFDGASVIIKPTYESLYDLRFSDGTDIVSCRYSTLRSNGKFIDWGGYHYGKMIKKDLDADEMNCYSHIAVFMEWSMRNGILSGDFLEEYSDMRDFVNDTSMDLRVYLRYRVANSGALGEEMFTEEGRDFVRRYYVFGENGYPAAVDDVSKEILGEEQYSSSEYKDEAYLFTPYCERYRDLLFSKLDKAWEKFKICNDDIDQVSANTIF